MGIDQYPVVKPKENRHGNDVNKNYFFNKNTIGIRDRCVPNSFAGAADIIQIIKILTNN